MAGPSPKISIVLPTYNRVLFIGKTIETVCNQTYKNWELIIVDDGSDDNTEEIVQKINDERIHFIQAGRIAINGKIKNIGMAKATGDLIAFIDSDDLWAATKLEKQVAALKEYPHAGFSLTGGFNFTDIHRPLDFFYKQRSGTRYGEMLVPFFRSEISTTTPSLIFRKHCLNTVKGFDETKPFSDVDFILKLANNFKAVILYEPLLYRRLHDSNDSGANWIQGYEQGIDLARLYKRKLSSPVFHEALFKLYINFGEDCLSRSQNRMALKKFALAWKNRPFSSAPLKKICKLIVRRLVGSDEHNADIPARAWDQKRSPKKILAIRLQAMGDVVITLPYLQALRNSLPSSTKIDLLTRKEYESIPASIDLFNKIISVKGTSLSTQLLHIFFILPEILWNRYDVVIDLQNNDLSRFVTKCTQPRAWSAFDKFSPSAAGERTRLTIEAVDVAKVGIHSNFHFKENVSPGSILKNNGWNEKSEIVVLNPAGAFATRNWPPENYVSFATLWLRQFPNTQFLVLGTPSIWARAAYLKQKLGAQMINLVDKTSPSEAFAIMQKVKFVLSEDSGLMHMAWVSGVPTLALFGSTRSDWSRPLAKNSSFLDSTDLACGNCMQETCAYGDNHCMTRYTAEFIFEKALSLVGKNQFVIQH